MHKMNSLKREQGTRISPILICATAIVALGLLGRNQDRRASAQPPAVIRIDGKDRPVASFAANSAQAAKVKTPDLINASKSPVSSGENSGPIYQNQPAITSGESSNTIDADQLSSGVLAELVLPTTTATSTPFVGFSGTPEGAIQLTWTAEDSCEILDEYASLPEVIVEQLGELFHSAENHLEPVRSHTPITMASFSLDGLGLAAVNDQSLAAAVASTGQREQDLPAADREKLAVETLLKSINNPQTNLMQMRSIDAPQWLGQIQFAMLRYGSHADLSLQDAVYTAIQFAPEIEILRADVGISQAEITKQQANFDWSNFVQSNWDEKNVPVASTLDGVFSRLENHTLANSLGVTKKNTVGGNVKLAQDLGFADSNSSFFNPQNQANSRIALDFQQPLLQGAGLLTTTSRINIAIANAAVSQEQFLAGLQTHILNVIQAYWDLTAARGQFVIRKRSYERALETATVVSNRVHLDVGPVQSARSEATLGARRAALIGSEYTVVLAQEKLLRLMFGQYFRESVNSEIIPTSNMIGPSREVDMELELQLGLQCRPEVRQSLQTIKRTSIEQGVAKNQLLPLLGLTMSLSNKGLRGNNGLGSAFNDQFSFGDPTYGVGLAYQLPVGNRVARANYRQAQIRLVRFQKEFETVVSTVALEIRNASHNVANTTQQRDATAQSMKLVERELDVLKSRAELLLDGDKVGPLYLEDLLSTQERLATAESAFLTASTAHALSYFELQRANGSLLRAQSLPIDDFAGR